MATSHYNLPEFDGNGTVDLMNIYNKAIESIDSNLYTASQEANAAKATADGAVIVNANQDSQLHNISQLANAASAAASKAQSTADTAKATADGAVIVNANQDSQLHNISQLANAASAAASKAQSTADTAKATADGAVAVNNKHDTDISNIKTELGNLQIFTPTAAQLAAMNSGVTSNIRKQYRFTVPTSAFGAFSHKWSIMEIDRVGAICILTVTDVGFATAVPAQTKSGDIVPTGFRPATNVMADYSLWTLYPTGQIRTPSHSIGPKDYDSGSLVYITTDPYPDDSYVVDMTA